METSKGNNPPELVIKLALQFLQWENDIVCGRDPHNFIDVAPLVCKQWNSLLDTEDVGRPLCENQLHSYENILQEFNQVRQAQAEQEQLWCSPHHELLEKLLEEPLPPGRTYRDIFS